MDNNQQIKKANNIWKQTVSEVTKVKPQTLEICIWECKMALANKILK